jgi:hypothetical protein
MYNRLPGQLGLSLAMGSSGFCSGLSATRFLIGGRTARTRPVV